MKLLKIFLVILGLFFLVLLIYKNNPGEIINYLRLLGPGLFLICLPFFVVYIFDTLGWKFSFKPSGTKISFPVLFSIRLAGETINYLTPVAYLGGEPVKALLLKEKGVSLKESISSMIISKTALILSQMIFILSGIIFLFLKLEEESPSLASISSETNLLIPLIKRGLFFGIFVLLPLIVILLIGILKKGLFLPLLNLLARLKIKLNYLEKRRENFLQVDREIINFYRINRQHFYLAFFFHLLGWYTGVLEVFLILYYMKITVGFLTLLIIEILFVSLKGLFSFIPASLGAQEGGSVAVFLLLGLSSSAGITFGIMKRTRELIFACAGWMILASSSLNENLLPKEE